MQDKKNGETRHKTNKFVQTKMRLKLGTKTELQRKICREICQILSDSVRFVRFAGLIDLSDMSISRFKKNARQTTDHGPRTDPHIEMCGRI